MRPPTSILLTISLSLLLRSLIAFHPHSGQNDHHGSKVAYGGDYEAQRHWMELTIHLPLSRWYSYDTQYWGLDYPPLTAYGSFLLGLASQVLVGAESVALVESRGYEDIIHKAFMRGTVIALDCLVYIPAAYLIVKRLCGGRKGAEDEKNNKNGNEYENGGAFLLLGVLIQPALVIIDHGHFQYNAVCLGLALVSFHFMTKTKEQNHQYNIGWNSIIGSILFCLALNWKQMALYYAPAVFAYLLGRCCCGTFFGKRRNLISTSKQVAMLGVTVVATFVILWFPFYYYRHDLDETAVDVFAVILRRIFPFSRGLFEGKVGNLWCAASAKPISIRERIPVSIQPLCALALTFCMVLPFCVILFNVGRMAGKTEIVEKESTNLHIRALLWGSAGSSLSFFLASFQVHEKSILLPLAPLSLLMMDQPSTIHWFSIVSMWSMWHLIVVDRLRLAYFSLITIYLCYAYTAGLRDQGGSLSSSKSTVEIWDLKLKTLFTRFIIPLSSFAMVGLHVLEMCITPPPNLPDLFPVLWVIESCLSFCVMWLISLWELMKLFATNQEEYQQKKEK